MGHQKPSKSSTIEDEEYWLEKIEEYKRSNLSHRAYCAQHKISYSRFHYWYYKLTAQKHTASKVNLVPVKTSSSQDALPILCTLVLSNGSKLLVHDMSVIERLLGGVS